MNTCVDGNACLYTHQDGDGKVTQNEDGAAPAIIQQVCAKPLSFSESETAGVV